MRLYTVTSLVALAVASNALGTITINEVRTGAGNAQYVEFKGEPGESLAGLTFLIIGDGTTGGASPTRSGCVEWIWRFSETDVIGPNGFLVLHNPGQNPDNAADASGVFPFTVDPGCTNIAWTYTASGLAVDTQFERSKNQTYALVSGFYGTDSYITRAPGGGNTGQDLDINDDGNLDYVPWDVAVDWMSVKQTDAASPGSGQTWWYAPVIAGPAQTRALTYPTQQVTVAGWDFQTTSNSNAGTATLRAPNTPKVFNSNAGVGTLYLDGSNGSGNWDQVTELDAQQGSNLNATGTGTGGNGLDATIINTGSLVLFGGTGNAANGKSLVFKFSMSGIAGLNISYATRASNTLGFTTQTWQYSTDGSNWTNVPSGQIVGMTTSFAVKNIPTLSALDGQATAYVRCVFAGATGATGLNRIDNVVFSYTQQLPPTVVVTNAAPAHAFKRTSGSWVVGNPSTLAGSALDTIGSANPAWDFPCGDPNAGSALAAHWNPGSSDACCCNWVCASDAFCCATGWDALCVSKAAGCAAQCAVPCPADLNGDHAVDGADLGLMLGNWGPCPSGCAADLNGDNEVTGADLGLLLGAWGACP